MIVQGRECGDLHQFALRAPRELQGAEVTVTSNDLRAGTYLAHDLLVRLTSTTSFFLGFQANVTLPADFLGTPEVEQVV